MSGTSMRLRGKLTSIRIIAEGRRWPPAKRHDVRPLTLCGFSPRAGCTGYGAEEQEGDEGAVRAPGRRGRGGRRGRAPDARDRPRALAQALAWSSGPRRVELSLRP